MTVKDIVLKKYADGEIRTDSDVLDIADECHVDPKHVYMIISKRRSIGTPCEGCRHIAGRFFYSPGFPCKGCSRNNETEDYFEAEKEE